MKSKKGDCIFRVCNASLMTIIGIITAYPFIYMLIYSLSDPVLASSGVYLWPKGFTLANYVGIFKGSNIWGAIFVSVARTVIGTVLTVLCSSIFAYAVCKPLLPCRKLVYRLVIITMYLSVGLIPWYVTMIKIGMKNNFLLYILPSAVVPFFIILIKTYFEGLPPAIEESAMVDGAGYWTIFFKMILPMSKPIIMTVVLFQAVNQWNSWTDNLYLCSSPKLLTLQMMLYNYLNQASAITTMADAQALSGQIMTPTSIRMTMTIIAILPIFLVYPFVQKYFMKGILVGAVKG